MKTSKDEKQWPVQSHAETLIRPKEIQQDKTRYNAALKYCREQCETLKRVTEGKANG